MSLADNILGFHHVSIKALKMNETISFYKQLGFIQVHDWSLPEFQLEKCVMLHNPVINYYIEICDKNANFPTQGRVRNEDDEYIENNLLHFCFTVKDAAQAEIDAIKIGAIPLSHGIDRLVLKNKIKSVEVTNSLVYGPNGEVIEFLEEVSFI